MSKAKVKDKLTPEEEALIEVVKQEYLDIIKNKPVLNMEIAEKVINSAYDLAGFAKPKIHVCDSLLEANLRINKILGNKELVQYDTDYYTSVYSMGFYAFYDFFTRIGVLNHEKFNQLLPLKDSGIFATISFDTDCFIIPFPDVLELNEAGDLHCVTGPAIAWTKDKVHEFNGKKMKAEHFFINGRHMPSYVFDPKITRKTFLDEQDEDIRAGMYEVIEARGGEGAMLKFLDAEMIHEESIVHANGETEFMELYRTKDKFAGEEDLNGNSPAQLAWLKIICPSTGTVYLVPSDASFKTCTEAAKFARPDEIGDDVPYTWDLRS